MVDKITLKNQSSRQQSLVAHFALFRSIVALSIYKTIATATSVFVDFVSRMTIAGFSRRIVHLAIHLVSQ